VVKGIVAGLVAWMVSLVVLTRIPSDYADTGLVLVIVVFPMVAGAAASWAGGRHAPWYVGGAIGSLFVLSGLIRRALAEPAPGEGGVLSLGRIAAFAALAFGLGSLGGLLGSRLAASPTTDRLRRTAIGPPARIALAMVLWLVVGVVLIVITGRVLRAIGAPRYVDYVVYFAAVAFCLGFALGTVLSPRRPTLAGVVAGSLVGLAALGAVLASAIRHGPYVPILLILFGIGSVVAAAVSGGLGWSAASALVASRRHRVQS